MSGRVRFTETRMLRNDSSLIASGSAAAASASPALSLTEPQRAVLAETLPRAMSLLSLQRTAEVPQEHLDAYVALGWMRWAAGRLLITPSGKAMRDSVVAQQEQN